MVERKLFKTKICALYQKGHCTRHSCSFAHGIAELRHFSASFNGRRDYHGSDLRNKIDRRHSPLRSFSPGRDTRRRRAHTGYSPSRSPERNSESKRRKKQPLDGQSDFSGSLKVSGRTDDHVREGNITSSGSKKFLAEQLKQVESEINKLNDHKGHLEVCLNERDQEIDSLNSRIQELNVQLYKEKEECKRLASKIKKFVKATKRHSKIEDELKRSQVRLQKLADRLGSDIIAHANGEDSSINIVSDEETIGNSARSPRDGREDHASLSKKRTSTTLEFGGNLINGGSLVETLRSERPSQWNIAHPRSNHGIRSPANEAKRKQGKSLPLSIGLAEKFNSLDSELVLPSTGMATYAVDEPVIPTDTGEKIELVEPPLSGIKQGVEDGLMRLSFPLPPPPPLPPTVRPNIYSQYKGNEDENVDVGDMEEMVVVDVV